MIAGRFRSFAKVNLHLQVVGRRPDGYHELRTVFQMIDLHDRIEIEVGRQASPGIALEVSDPRLPAGPENLAWRAAEAFRERWAPDLFVRLRLEKQIPVGGGLGGGSGNAATVLLALQALCGRPAERVDLEPIARELGADVPFFLLGGTALGFGRGDELVALPPARPEPLLLALPAASVPTAEIFRGLSDLTGAPLAPTISGLLRGAGRRGRPLGEYVGWNDLQETVFRLFPAVAAVYDHLLSAGARWVRLSGSGAALVASFPDHLAAARAGESLPAGASWRRVRPIGRRAWSRRWRLD